MKINIAFNFNIDMPDCKIDTIIAGLKKVLPLFLTQFVKTILMEFANHYMLEAEKPFSCDKCSNNKSFIWKTRNAKSTTIVTIFGEIILGQLQIQCKTCGHKMFITRKLLEICRYQKMSRSTMKIFALIGSLASFRVSEKILGMFNIPLNKITVWRCVQKIGEDIEFDLDLDEAPRGQADGTGIPIQGIKKRGKELKVFIQEKIGGGIRIAGLAIGNYDSGWNKLFDPVLETLKLFPKFLLTTDGDTSILKGIKSLNIIFQRCLWHIPHQMKYYLWKDKAERKSKEWLYVMCRLIDITTIRSLLHDEDEIDAVIKLKTDQLKEIIKYCREHKWNSCATYLQNAMPDMFTAFKNKLNGKTTSKVERVMRTVNLRINVGKWSMTGALNAVKIRLAYYYNGFDIDKQNDNNITVRIM